MKKFALSLSALACALTLAACSPSTTSADAMKAAVASIPDKQPVSLEAIAATAQGFTTGAVMSTQQVYVFFDPQCPHCAHLWQASKALHPQAKFTWIPVALLSKASRTQGAALLAASEPAKAMDEHEALLSQKRGGMAASSDVAEAQDIALAKNTQLLRSFGADSVPFVVAKHAQTGAIVSFPGAMPPAQLAQTLGLAAPAAQ